MNEGTASQFFCTRSRIGWMRAGRSSNIESRCAAADPIRSLRQFQSGLAPKGEFLEGAQTHGSSDEPPCRLVATGLARAKFSVPETLSRRGQSRARTTVVSTPEASADEDRSRSVRKGSIGVAGELRALHAVAEFRMQKNHSRMHLGSDVPGPDP